LYSAGCKQKPWRSENGRKKPEQYKAVDTQVCLVLHILILMQHFMFVCTNMIIQVFSKE